MQTLMYAGRKTGLAFVAVLAAVVLGVVTTAAAIPGPWHSNLLGRNCDICRSGHLPTLAALGPVQIHASVLIEWNAPLGRPLAVHPPVIESLSTRAPPA